MRWGGFDPQPTLEGRSLWLRPLSSSDRSALFAAASDAEIWSQHPARDRHLRPVFDRYFDHLTGTGAALAIHHKGDDRLIGASSYYVTPEDPPALSIGFTFIARAYWGGALNFELKSLMLDHLFAHADTAWFHIGPNNLRSQKGTEKLGVTRLDIRRLDLGTGADDYVTYRLSRADWAARCSQ